MTNFQIVISILSILVSILTLLGVGVVMKHFWDDKHEEKKANAKEAKDRAKAERQNEIREVFREESKPILDQLTTTVNCLQDIHKKIGLLQDSVVALDRILMKLNLDLYKRQGYASASDRAAWNELYNNYKGLGGNHFKEYVNQWKQSLDRLPTKEDEEHQNNTTNN